MRRAVRGVNSEGWEKCKQRSGKAIDDLPSGQWYSQLRELGGVKSQGGLRVWGLGHTRCNFPGKHKDCERS
jgi:hypothetical protein